MTPVDRRTFIKDVAAASGMAVAADMVAPEALPASVPPPAGPQAATQWKKAPCRLCGVGCGLLIGVDGGRAVAVKGDPDSPVSKGLGCAKGYNAAQVLYGSDRITRAMVRRDGALVPVPLGEALDLVARRLKETRDRYGKDSVALYGSAQWSITDAYLAAKLFKGALGTNNIETSTRLYSASAMTGLRGTFGLDGAVGGYEDIDHADVIVLWDVNLAESDPVLFSRMLDRKRSDPAVRIIDIATRTTRTSYASDHSLLHAPHAALAIAHGICHEIVARRWVQHGFVDRHVAFKRGPVNLGDGLAGDALAGDPPADATWADYVEFLKDYRPDKAQAWSGLAAASIRWLASLYGDPLRKVVSVWGREVNQDHRGSWTNNALHNIHLLVGKVATPGNGAFSVSGQPSGGCSVHEAGAMTDALPGGLVTDEGHRRRAADIWGVPLEQLDPAPASHALGIFRRLERGDIRFLWIQATDPMVSLPNLDRYRKAAGGEGRFIVVSEAYPTPTTEVADVVLPAAMWLEREGIYGNSERRLQHFDRVVPPPGDATSDGWQMVEVARRLGFGTLFAYDPRRSTSQAWDEYRLFHTDPATELPGLDLLRGQAGVQWPCPSGKETQWRYNAAFDPAADDTRGTFDFYGHPDHRAWIWLRPYEAAAEAPDAAFPYWFMTGVVLEHWGSGSMTRRVPALRQALPHAYVELNADDARELGIRNREVVRVTSRRGSLELEARIDYRSQPPRGLAFAPVFDQAHPVNRLTLDASCPISGQPDGGKCAVRIERAGTRGGA